jgi:hypothetical protein
LTQAERARGYASLMMAIRAGQIPSRTAAHLRHKIRQSCTRWKKEGERIANEQRQKDAAESFRRKAVSVADSIELRGK